MRELITAKCYYPAFRDFDNAIHKSIKTQERSNDTPSGVPQEFPSVPQEFLKQLENFRSLISVLFLTSLCAK